MGDGRRVAVRSDDLIVKVEGNESFEDVDCWQWIVAAWGLMFACFGVLRVIYIPTRRIGDGLFERDGYDVISRGPCKEGALELE
jgi:hypothetical protein